MMSVSALMMVDVTESVVTAKYDCQISVLRGMPMEAVEPTASASETTLDIVDVFVLENHTVMVVVTPVHTYR